MKTYLNTQAKNLQSIVILLSLSISGMMLSSCSKEETAPPSLAATQTGNQRIGQSDKPVIYFEQLGGFRGTPQFLFGVYDNGRVHYEGIRNVGTMGTKEFDVSPETVQQLVDFMVMQGFLDMKEEYPYVCDASKHYTLLRSDAGRKSVHKAVTDHSAAVPYELMLVQKTLKDKLGITALTEKHVSAVNSIQQILQ